MNLVDKKGQRTPVGRIGSRVVCVAAVFASLFALPGCQPSKEEQAKQDEQGKQTNEDAMKRMMQEQGKMGGMGAGGR